MVASTIFILCVALLISFLFSDKRNPLTGAQCVGFLLLRGGLMWDTYTLRRLNEEFEHRKKRERENEIVRNKGNKKPKPQKVKRSPSQGGWQEGQPS